MLTYQVTTKIPRRGTYVRTFLDEWAQSGRRLTFTEAARMYAKRPAGRSPSMRHVGLTLTRYLKRFGERTRDQRGRSLGWRVRPAVVAALEEGRMTAVEDVVAAPRRWP